MAIIVIMIIITNIIRIIIFEEKKDRAIHIELKNTVEWPTNFTNDSSDWIVKIITIKFNLH